MVLLALGGTGVVLGERGDPPTVAGVPEGTVLTPTGRLVVKEDGAVIDSMDVSGQILVQADDVRIVRTRVTYGGYHAIRIYSGASGTVIEDTTVVCGSTSGRGTAFGRYAAQRVEVNGCARAFVTTAGDVSVTESLVDGERVELEVGPRGTPAIGDPVTPTTVAAVETTTTVPTSTPSTTSPPPSSPPTTVGSQPSAPSPRVPGESALIAEAGPSDPAALRSSGSITVAEDGEVVENVRVSGTITVKANNVTIRNCHVRGYSNVGVIRTVTGFKGTRIESCYLEAIPGPDGAGANGVIVGGKATHVSRSEITGFADGIKAESGSTYEYNYIHTYKPPGSEKHLDGIQGSGDSDFTIRGNVIDQPVSDGGNSAIFVQAFNGSNTYKIGGITIQGNYLRGGNYTVFLLGDSNLQDAVYKDNKFARDGNRYGYSTATNCGAVVSSGNVFKDDGKPVPGTC